jgi:hypothetical protein
LQQANLPGKKFPSTPRTETLTCRSNNSCKLLRPRIAQQNGGSSAVKETFRHIQPARRVRIYYGGKLLPGPNVNRNTGDLLSLQLKQEREMMKKMLLSMALTVVAPFAWGQVSETSTTTTTTTDANGTITEYTPGSAIVLRESSGPRRFRFGKTVTYVTRSGKTLDEDTVRTKVKVGVPVRVHYVGTGDNMMVDRVILDED